MASLTHAAETQLSRIDEFFRGPHGRANYDQLRLHAETMSARYKMLSGWAALSGEEFLHEAINCCMNTREDGNCVRRIPTDVPVNVALFKIMESLISHAFHNKGRRSRDEMPSPAGNNDSFEPKQSMWSNANDRLTPEQREDALSRVDEFVAFAKPDRVLHGMLLLIKNEGLDRPASLVAGRLGVAETEIYLARKRLASAVTRFINQVEAA